MIQTWGRSKSIKITLGFKQELESIAGQNQVRKTQLWGIAWWSNGQDSTLSLPRAQGSVPGKGTKIPQAASQCGQKKKKEGKHKTQLCQIYLFECLNSSPAFPQFILPLLSSLNLTQSILEQLIFLCFSKCSFIHSYIHLFIHKTNI